MLYLLFAAMLAPEVPPSYHYSHSQPDIAAAGYLKLGEAGAAAPIEASIVLQELGRNAEAVSLLEKAAEAAPDDAGLNTELGWAILRAGDPEKAAGIFAKAEAKGRPGQRAELGAALAGFGLGDYKAAGARFRRLAGDRVLAPLASYFLGRIAEAGGDAQAAAEQYRKAVKQDSHFFEARPRLARLLEAQGLTDDAWKEYSRIASVDPAQKYAAEKKRSLLALLTKKPEELLAVKKIRDFTRVKPGPGAAESPEVRIGIGTSAGGSPVYRQRIVFRSSGDFSVSDLATGRELAAGKAGETWEIIVSSGTGSFANPPQTAGAGSARLSDPGKQAAGGALILGPDGRAAAFSGSVKIRRRQAGGTFIVEAVPYGPGMAWGGAADKELRGELEVILKKPRGLYVVNRLSLEEYLYGVIAAEMPAHWPAEALKAQAVIARTFALYVRNNLHPHGAHGYDLCDDQHCQVYAGVPVESPKIISAADQTRGKVLAHRGKAIHAVFSSNCGGRTQSGAGAGWGDLPYWKSVGDGGEEADLEPPAALAGFVRGVPEVFCRPSKYTWTPESRWTRYIPAEELSARLNRKAAIGDLKKIVFRRGESGRVSWVRFIGSKNAFTLVKENEIRRVFGLAPLRSTLFSAEVFYENGLVKNLLIYGAGWGHGVGLCQSGAAGRAERGDTYDRILPQYYDGAELADLGGLN